MSDTPRSIQYYVRIPPAVNEEFKRRCKQQGRSHAEVARFLLSEYAGGRLDMRASYTQPTLGDALS